MIVNDFKLDDVFIISEIIDKMGLEADIEKITKTIKTSKLGNKKDAMKLGKEVAVGVGIDIVTKMVRNLFKAQKEVKKLISSLTGLTEKEVSQMGIKQLKEFFTELFESDGIEDFLSQAEDTKEKN